MDEIVYIMKCRDERGQIVIPIFYDVYPWEVRSERGDYEEAFSKHESMNPYKAELWRKALNDASNINGWIISEIADGHEAKGIQLIVKKISNILFPDKDLIGLQTCLGDIKYGAGGRIPISSSSHENLEHLRIPIHEILLATNNFSKNNIIAEGGFGKVYQGLSTLL
ncbi:putative TIR domain, protein kinase-like domain superfamily [Helianthus annuus]|nr:putative TIR domain, protein kinase-like domain superfamily [Helianthus annuus]